MDLPLSWDLISYFYIVVFMFLLFIIYIILRCQLYVYWNVQ